MTEESKTRIMDILLFYGIHEDFKVENVFDGNGSLFLQNISNHLSKHFIADDPVDSECLIYLICEFSRISEQGLIDPDFVVEMIKMLCNCAFSGKSTNRLLDILRSSIKIPKEDKEKEDLPWISPKFHTTIMTALKDGLFNDNPNHISFPGDKDSYVQVSSITLNCPKAYSLSIWMKYPKKGLTKGFLLFRCRTPGAGIDALVTNIENDNTLTLLLRVNMEKKGLKEVSCKISMDCNSWHLLTLKQVTGTIGKNDKVFIIVDGEVIVETDLIYPFSNNNESLWVFGIGYKGLIASITLHSDDVPNVLCQLMYYSGPYMSDISLGVSCPQSSVDTGHLTLGTQIAKGQLATKSCKLSPVFCVKATNFIPDASLPQLNTGKQYIEHIEMIPRTSECDSHIIVSKQGGCTVSLTPSWIDIWMEAGGCTLLLYMHWTYVTAINSTTNQRSNSLNNNNSNNSAVNMSTDINSDAEMIQCIKHTMILLKTLLLSSAEFKEQFIQIHGFHVLGYCLSSLSQDIKKIYLDESLIQVFIDLVLALGPDLLKGDGIAAALQGLLFDFRIWGCCQIQNLRFYLERLSSLLLESGDQLYKCIGIQRILDIFRLYVVRANNNIQNPILIANIPANSSLTSNANTDYSKNRDLIECADSIHRLLIIAMDSARIFSAKSKTNLFVESEMIVMCVEETNNNLVAERLLRLIGNYRITAPISITQAFNACRYYDTVVISLLSKKGFSIEVRCAALTNLFWLLSEELKQIPQQIIQTRKILNTVTSSANQQSSSSNSRNNTRHGSVAVLAPETARIKSLTNQIAELIKPLEKGWLNMNMVAEVLNRALDHGIWGNQIPPSLLEGCALNYSNNSSNHKTKNSNNNTVLINEESDIATAALSTADMDQLVSTIVHNNSIEGWLLLPIIPVITSRASMDAVQHLLMSINVLYKTDEGQIETIACLPDRSWIRLFIALALIGEMFMLKHSSNINQLTTQLQMELNIANTCVELALDSLSIVIEYKTRHHYNESWSTWNCLQNCIKLGCSLLLANNSNSSIEHAENVEQKFLKRCVSLSLQRLAKSTDGWNSSLINSIINVLSLIENRKLCGNLTNAELKKYVTLIQQQQLQQQQAAQNNTLLDLELTSNSSSNHLESEIHKHIHPQSSDEMQIMCFVMDMIASLRKASERGALNGIEWRAVKSSLIIILGCLTNVNEHMIDRVTVEIMSQIKYMCEPWAPMSGNKLKQYLMKILSALRSVIKDPVMPDYLRGRCTALVFMIMHHFIDIRYTLTMGGAVPEHVSDVLQALNGIDSCNDIDLIFKLLDVTMRKAEAISFDNNNNSDNNSNNSNSSESYVSEFPKLTTITNNEEDSNSNNATRGGQFVTLDHDRDLIDESIATPVPSNSSNNNNILDFGDNDISKTASNNNKDNSVKTVSIQDFLNDPEINQHLQSDYTISESLGQLNVDLLNLNDNSSNNAANSGDIANNNSNNTDPLNTIDSQSSSTALLSPDSKQQQTQEETVREKNYLTWLKIRQGISSERVDTERSRLAKSMDTLDLTSEATKKFWKKARRKVESESFLESHPCQWKLGVSHEGHFFGRKRIVLRPRLDNEYALTSYSSNNSNHNDNNNKGDNNNIDGDGVATDELNRALAKACAGYINDVTRLDADETAKDTAINNNNNNNENSSSANVNTTVIPGTGWGIVDVDGSDEGYGVVGLDATAAANIDNDHTNKAVGITSDADSTPTPDQPPHQDMLGDVKQAEENFKQGKGIETGPCHSGTRRAGSGPVILEAKAIMITASGNVWGNVSFNGKEIFFCSTFEKEDGHKEDSAAVNLAKQKRMRRRRWNLSSVSGIYLRRFRLRDSAIEVFFSRGKHRNFFLDFGHTRENAKQRNEFAKALMQAAPTSAFKQVPNMSHFRLVYDHGVQEKWLNGKMSNFDYLMALNTLAGRSYNDLCQYPVFPWVISDYESPVLDLNDRSIYRDLSKPMGALNPTRLNEFLDRFNSFGENVTSGIPAFMYGSHYSTMVGVVLHFLVRLQPFAALHKEMQNGHFDVPDRLFSSIPRSWKHNTTQLSEVKELTPEWFTTPEMFKNINHFQFGQTQDNEVIDDVELPPWAKSAEEFVRINRDALESDYVTEHLHEWIDLIFGYKQRGPDSVEACNVFYYLTYYGSVDHYLIADEALRRATELQIAHFGQIPMQLFKVPHPARKISGPNATLPTVRQLKKCFASDKTDAFVEGMNDEEMVALEAAATLVNKSTNTIPINISVLNDRVLCILDNGVIEVLKYATSEEAKSALIIASANVKPSRKRSVMTSSSSSAVASDNEGSVHSNNDNNNSSNNDNNNNSDIINFEDPFEMFLNPTPPPPKPVKEKSTNSNNSNSSQNTLPPAAQDTSLSSLPAVNHRIMSKHDILITVEKEFTHFDTVPRVPLTKTLRNTHYHKNSKEHNGDFVEKLYKVKPSTVSDESKWEQAAGLVHFTKSSNLVITIGHVDGRACVRELDTKTGFVKTAGDFRAHKKRIVSLATDTIACSSSGKTDVVVTCDEAGIIMVWTISKVRGGLNNLSYSHVISRRPQRLFRCDPQSDMYCDISWQMGIVVVVCGSNVNIYSIERDELLRSFQLDAVTGDNSDYLLTSLSSLASREHSRFKDIECSFTGPETHVLGYHNTKQALMAKGGDIFRPKCITRRVTISDYGQIVVHMEVFSYMESLLEYEDQMKHQHVLVSYTLTGQCTGIVQCESIVTYLHCPDKCDIIVTGHLDGSVIFYRVLDLFVLHVYKPHLNCLPLTISLTPSKGNYNVDSNNSNSTKNQRKSSMISGSSNNNNNRTSSNNNNNNSNNNNNNQTNNFTVDPSPIICISMGPNRYSPSMICVTTANGNMFFKAMPDFIKWEKGRSPSALAQLASVPLQAVKGTIQQAQNWTAETANVLAANARSLADEALGELKKIDKNKIMKGVSNFFGFGKSKPNDDEDEEKKK